MRALAAEPKNTEEPVYCREHPLALIMGLLYQLSTWLQARAKWIGVVCCTVWNRERGVTYVSPVR